MHTSFIHAGLVGAGFALAMTPLMASRAGAAEDSPLRLPDIDARIARLLYRNGRFRWPCRLPTGSEAWLSQNSWS